MDKQSLKKRDRELTKKLRAQRKAERKRDKKKTLAGGEGSRA